jgi:hypothetical protein
LKTGLKLNEAIFSMLGMVSQGILTKNQAFLAGLVQKP